MLVQLSDVHFGYPGTEIFEGLSWQVNPGARIGLVGPNGSGKSTLLRLIDGRLEPDSGQVARVRGLSVGYLQQSQEFAGQGRLIDALLFPFKHILALHEEIVAIEAELAKPGHADHDRLLERYGTLQDRYTHEGGYTLESRLKALIHDLGFQDTDLERTVDTLSGGERGRLELTKALLAEPDLMLLDEPTNHLDVEATERLERRLREWPKAFVLVSHDRYFLRAVCNEIVEVEDGDVVRFPCGYDRYLVEREERHARLLAEYERQRAHIERTEDFIRRNIAGQKTKQAQGRRKMLERLERLSRPTDDMESAGRIGLRFSVGDHPGGKDAIVADKLSVGYAGAQPLVRDLDLTIYRGDRVGIIGPNGAGKSTLLKTLLGRLPAQGGSALLGHEVRIGYFDQKLSDLDDDRSLIDEIRQVRGDLNEDVARTYLGRFRFTGDDGFRKVKGLSGGERNRLTLAKMMLRPRNLLALDEPTNHLDIPAREVLEQALDDYQGTVLVVSHDRFFLDRVVNRILHIDGQGAWDVQPGNYTDWKDRQASGPASAPDAPAPAPATARPAGRPTVAEAPEGDADAKRARIEERERKKAGARELERKKKRLTELEEKIGQLEAELARLNASLAEDHGGNWQRLHEAVAERDKIDQRLRSALGEWEKLGAELERG